MKNWQVITAFILVFVLIIVILKIYPPPKRENQTPIPNNNMQITSSAFVHNGNIPVNNTCDGENLNPPLTFTDIPRETKSLTLVIEDPDAPNGTFTHLKKTDIPPAQAGYSEGEFKDYVAPCPPSGTHRYYFILTALNDKGEIISKAELIGLYGK